MWVFAEPFHFEILASCVTHATSKLETLCSCVRNAKEVCDGPTPRPHVSGFLTTHSRAASVRLHDVACKRYQTPDARTRAPSHHSPVEYIG